jgi:hypothetical protein
MGTCTTSDIEVGAGSEKCNIAGLTPFFLLDFVDTNLQNAKKKFDLVKSMPDGNVKWENVKASLEVFGAAMHPVMDNRSPEHAPFQKYEPGRTLLDGAIFGSPLGLPGMVGGAIGAYGGSTAAHVKGESGEPTEAERNLMVDEIRTRFRETYGDEAYRTAVSEEERKKTEERMRQREHGDMLKK